MILMIFSISMVTMALSWLIMTITSFLSKKTFSDREKNSPFECGFDPKSSARTPFSLHFFLIAVIFLIFDVEITLLLPIMITMKMMNLTQFISLAMFFIIILLVGLYHEWNQGALTWAM
ncbi:NADH dehydrogenase subunit 3 (mitochondrion) [Agrilus planipennis]|uniref:NADH-ubiquinone oxidoreductase chain 3 n=1 Tax=Agrilus planipennis TaxID=224129 RepID=A0A1B0VGY1_AGRPL|nr:NADH dehydrogenase subunit 3 [Agrilus planipennis]AMV73991.1 NADH dehydrogenase subunit 3 [Agrilus planipennis]